MEIPRSFLVPPAVLVLLLASLEVWASEEPEAPLEGASVRATPVAWVSPPPDPNGFDWIRLTSDEWLKGEILVMQRDKIEFDSDELEELTLDWEDVAEFRSPRGHTYVFEDRSMRSGPAWIRDGTIRIRTENGDETYLRENLLTILPGEPTELNYWSAKASVGLAFRRGNTNQADLTYNGYLRRRGPFLRTRLDYSGSLGSVDSVESVNTHRGRLKCDLHLSRRFYITPGMIEALYDRFKNIEVQLVPAAGAGVQLIDRQKIELDLELLGGYQHTRYLSVKPGEEGTKGVGAIIPMLRLESDPFRRVEFDAEYSLRLGIPDPRDSVHHAQLVLSVELTKVLDLDVTWTWDRVEQPVPEADGTVPEQDDVRLSVGLSIDI